MNKRVFVLLAGSFLMGFLSSCSENEGPGTIEEQKVLVKFVAAPAIEGAVDAKMLDGLNAVFTEIRNQDTTHCILDQNGEGLVNLYNGTYNIAIESKVRNTAAAQTDSIVLSVRMENISVNQTGQEISGKLNVFPVNASGNNFIFSEVFFNGERNTGIMMHPDQYIVVFNPTNETLYADGVSIGVANQLTWAPKELWYDSFYPNSVPMPGFITVPGNGTEHPVAPGEKFVIAFTAIDHSKLVETLVVGGVEKVIGYDHAVDLSGADFEVYYGPESGDVDNPEVPNMLLTENGDAYFTNPSQGKRFAASFSLQPRGYFAPFMFKLENGETATIDKFVADNSKPFYHVIPETATTPADTIDVKIFAVPTEMIIDGIQTSDVPQDIKTRTIPEAVDRGKFLVSACHSQELAIRKEVKVGEKIFYQDTNDSSKDFVMQKGQNAYPKGWRDK